MYTSSYQKRMEMKHRPHKYHLRLTRWIEKKKKKKKKQRPSEMVKVLHVRSNICSSDVSDFTATNMKLRVKSTVTWC